MTDTSVVAIMVTLLLASVGFAFGYGILTNKVTDHTKTINQLEAAYKKIDDKLDSICNDVAAIRGTPKPRE